MDRGLTWTYKGAFLCSVSAQGKLVCSVFTMTSRFSSTSCIRLNSWSCARRRPSFCCGE